MDPLRKKHDELDERVTQLRSDAGQAWKDLDAAKKAVAESSENITPDHDLFKALDDAGKKYGEISDEIAAAEQVKAGLVDAMTRTGHEMPGGSLPPVNGGGKSAEELERRSPGERVIDSDDYKALIESGILSSGAAIGSKALGKATTRDELKALITGVSDTSAGAFVTPDRQGYYPMLLRPLTIMDLITVGQTDSDLVEFVRQTSFTNAAAETAEAANATAGGSSGAKPESAMAFEIVQEGVSTIAHWIPATRRALADAGQLRTIVDGLLRYGLDRRVEDQVIAGNGVGENLTGILNTTGTNAVPAGADSHADKVHFGITQIRVDEVEPNGVGMNPVDWETIRLSRENDDGTGQYLFGSPTMATQPTLWGLPVAVSNAIPQGTAIVGDWRAYILWLREGAQVLASDSHDNFFVRNLIAILAELRAAGGVPYPQAFSEVNLAAS